MKIDVKEPLVNIIIVTYNQFGLLEKCLQSISQSNYRNLKVCVVDDASSEDDYKRFYNKFHNKKDIKVLRLDKNIGYAGSCNFGLKQVNSGYVIFLNDDTIVSRDWLDELIPYMERNQLVGACQPKIRSLRNKDMFDYAGGAGGYLDVFGFPFVRGRIFESLENDRGQYNDLVNLVWASGACLITRYSIIKRLGGMDEIFFLYEDEVDFCWRLHSAGYLIKYFPSSIIYHYGSATISQYGSARKTFLHHRNFLILFFKNFTVLELIKFLPGRILLDIISMIFYLFKGEFIKSSFAVIAAYVNFIILMPKVLKRRKQVFSNRSRDLKSFPLYRGSIALDYYLFKKRKFSELDRHLFA